MATKRFRGKDNRVYTLITHTFTRAGQRIREVKVKCQRRLLKTFRIVKGVVSTFDVFLEFAAFMFPILKGSVAAFALAGL